MLKSQEQTVEKAVIDLRRYEDTGELTVWCLSQDKQLVDLLVSLCPSSDSRILAKTPHEGLDL